MIQESPACVAAFFDLDGTLLPAPSLERRFFRMLRYRRAIPVKNLFLWLWEAARLTPRGITVLAQANKMYLRGVRKTQSGGDGAVRPFATGVQGIHGNGRVQLTIPPFFAEAVHRVAWHASHGHSIVLVSGTLEPLAEAAARALERQVAKRGIAAEIHVVATRLEEAAGGWTGRLSGPAMFGEEKARAVRRLALDWGIDLAISYAYGNSTHDRCILAAVGHPTAVNPSKELARFARLRGWPQLRWSEAAHQTTKRKTRLTQETQPATEKAKHWNVGTL